MRVDYLVTLNEDAMGEKLDGADLDVLSFISDIPTLEVVSGGGVAAHVALDEEHVPSLMERCADNRCVMDVYAELDPQPWPPEFYV